VVNSLAFEGDARMGIGTEVLPYSRRRGMTCRLGNARRERS
jgi:hypothetical protein